jgi:protein O-mannosyl-transferase
MGSMGLSKFGASRRVGGLSISPTVTQDPVGSPVWGRSGLIMAAVLLFGTLLLYSGTYSYEFVHFDDDLFVFENEHVNKGLTAEGVAWAFGTPDIDYWRPLSWLSHMLDVELFGLKAGGHHFVSALWHAANAVLLFHFLLIATGRRWMAVLVAALFAWHPLHVESVAWISERKDVLSGFFWFACLIFYVRFAKGGRRVDYAAALGCFAIGLTCKPMIITLPFQLLLLDLWPLRRILGGPGKDVSWSRLVREKVPFFLLTMVGAISVVWAQNAVGALKTAEDYGLDYRLTNMAVSYATYLRDMVWPTHLIFFYEHDRNFGVARIVGAVILLIGVSVFAGLRIRKWPVLFSGWFWFLGTLVPVIGILQVGDQARADRYTYIALTGIFWVVAWLAGELAARSAGVRRFTVAVTTLAVAAAAGMSVWQMQFWRNSETLFERALAVDPDNRMPLNNLAYLRLGAGDAEGAMKLYQRLLEVDPDHDRAHVNLADIHEKAGRPRAAALHWARLVELLPEHLGARIGEVRTLLGAGAMDEAVKAASRSAVAVTNEPRLFPELVELFAGENRSPAVLDLSRQVVAGRPSEFAAHAQLLVEYRRQGMAEPALKAADVLLQQFPGVRETHYHAGITFAAFDEDRQARDNLMAAVRIDPSFAMARLELGRLFASARDPEVRDAAQALAIADGAEQAMGMPLPQTQEIRAELAWRRGEAKIAREHLRAAIRRAQEMKRNDLVPELGKRLAEMEPQ